MKKVNVLHIASFHGNIGDNANHNGLRNKLGEILGQSIVYDNLEMREFYQSWNLRDFNSEEFISLCNKYDLIIIGGGNFFELKWDYSHTGTTINLSEQTLEKIETPILFFGLGFDIWKGTNESNIKKFDGFLEYVTKSIQYLVTVRNDGSYSNLQKLYGDKYLNKVHKVFDGAFFLKTKERVYAEVNQGNKYLGINIVSDMKSLRFSNNITFDEFINALGDVVNNLFEKYPEYQVILFPHIYSDLVAISALLERINDKYRRTKITVAPCLVGEGSEDYIFGLYKQCEVVLGMRFHSNVCAIAQNIPTIALSSYKKINDLYEELNLVDRVIDVNEVGFEWKLMDILEGTLNNIKNIRSDYFSINEEKQIESRTFELQLKNWFESNEII